MNKRSYTVSQKTTHVSATYNSIGSRAASFKRPLLPADMPVCLCVCLRVGNFDAEYLRN